MFPTLIRANFPLCVVGTCPNFSRHITLRSDDSVVKHTAGCNRIIRRSRGYVPIPIFIDQKVPPILACGAELKNTICLAKDNTAFLSQHIGDLENQSANEFFELTIRHMQQILDIHPEFIAYDLHPDYFSTRYALKQQVHTFGIQHHHAHIVSAMAENKITGPVIGLSLDGTGYGIDSTIWGGEVLVADIETFHRAGHFTAIPIPGSETCEKPCRADKGRQSKAGALDGSLRYTYHVHIQKRHPGCLFNF